MRPILVRAVLVAACAAALTLAGCGRRPPANAPIAWAPADTPYLVAKIQATPSDVAEAWTNGALIDARIRQLGSYARLVGADSPALAKVLDAVEGELADVHSLKALTRATGLSESAPFAFYGIGDAPVIRYELESPDAFRAFWKRVENRAGTVTPTATLDGQSYWVIGGADARVHILVAIEGSQVVATVAPAAASADLLKPLLGLAKPARSAADRLGRIDSRHDYLESSTSGYIDLPKLVANLADGKDAVTHAFAKAVGVPAADPTCAGELQSLARQVPLATGGMHTYTTKQASGSLDVELSPELRGALDVLKQPVPGMAETGDHSIFDVVLAAPVQKWHAFIKGRAEAAASQTYQCPALKSLNDFAKTAANPRVQMPPEADSLLGFRVVLDTWTDGGQVAARGLVASSDPAALTRQIQQTLPQFALKTIPTDGKAVSFDVPPRLAAMLGGSAQGWVAANSYALALGVGAGEGAKMPATLTAEAGNGDRLMRVHLDGRVYALLGDWLGRLAGGVPGTSQAQIQQQAAALSEMGKLVASGDMDVKLDGTGLHLEADVKHR
ncbi:MAG: hypothetical protein ACREPL_13865 [Rhodanobacteraceae bacterium]